MSRNPFKRHILMAQDSQSSKTNLIIFAVASLVSLILVFTLIINRDSEEAEPANDDTQTTQETPDETSTTGADQDDVTEPDKKDDDAAESGNPTPEPEPVPAPTPSPFETGLLPADWDQLTPAEKTELNPFNCPTHENEIIYLSAETGECLDAPIKEEVIYEVVLPPNLIDVEFGKAFVYDSDSEVAVTGLDCSNLELFNIDENGLNLTLGQVLAEKAADYLKFKTDVIALFEEYSEQGMDSSYFTYYEYLQSLENYLTDRGLMLPGDDLAQKLINHLNCKVSIQLKNIGEDSYFPDGCGLRFARPVSLIGQRALYGAESRERVGMNELCTKNIVDFPNGDTAHDIVSFIVSSEDDIVGFLIQSPTAAFRVNLD